jgi:hypothetical protein
MGANKIYNLRMSEDLRAVIDKRAGQRMRSINNEMVILIKLGLVNETEESKALKASDELISRAKKEDK